MTTFTEDLDIATGVYTDRDRREEGKARVLAAFEQMTALCERAQAREIEALNRADAAEREVTRLTDAAKLASQAHMRTVAENEALRAQLNEATHNRAAAEKRCREMNEAAIAADARVKELEAEVTRTNSARDLPKCLECRQPIKKETKR